jgi:PhnB protein
MSDITTTPYIFFKGNANDAMEFYQRVFGGELAKSAYKDLSIPAPEGLTGNNLMHVALTGGKVMLFASDTALASPKAAKVSISLTGDDEAALTDIFNKLSEGADVQRQLRKEAWGDLFGSLTDQYGVEWMVNISQPKA